MAETEVTSESISCPPQTGPPTVRCSGSHCDLFFSLLSLGMETLQLAVCQEPVSIPLPLLVNEAIHAPCGT